MKARAAQKSSDQWFWYLESLFHRCSLMSKINVLQLQVQSIPKMQILLSERISAVPSTAHRQKCRKADFISMWKQE